MVHLMIMKLIVFGKITQKKGEPHDSPFLFNPYA